MGSEYRVLRLQSDIRLLERRGHVLSRNHSRFSMIVAIKSRSMSRMPMIGRSIVISKILPGRVWSFIPIRMRRSIQARGADLVVKASGVGVFDELLEQAVLQMNADCARFGMWMRRPRWTACKAIRAILSRALIPHYDLILTYGGGDPVVNAYRELGARECIPIYNALDPDTHYPVPPDCALRAIWVSRKSIAGPGSTCG